MTDFWVGARIEGKPSSNNEYFYTNEQNGYVGEVLRIYEYDDGTISLSARTIKLNDPSYIGEVYDVDAEHFYTLGNEYTLERLKVNKGENEDERF